MVNRKGSGELEGTAAISSLPSGSGAEVSPRVSTGLPTSSLPLAVATVGLVLVSWCACLPAIIVPLCVSV